MTKRTLVWLASCWKFCAAKSYKGGRKANRSTVTRTALVAAILCLSTALTCGCTSILETERVLVTPHEEMSTAAPDTQTIPEVTSYEELLEVTRDLLVRGQSSGRVNVFEYEGDLNADATSVREQLLFRDALGSYALSDVMLAVTPIVSYWDIQINLFYRRAAEQIDKLITISTQRYLQIELLSMMSDYREDAAIMTSLSSVTVVEVLGYLRSIYYNNPLEVVMPPITTIEVYPPQPEEGGERIFELHFAYNQSRSVLNAYTGWIKSAARDIAESVSGENDAEILLSFCTALAELSEYDSALGSLSEYSSQSLAATAYGALQNGSAIGEGYAMAFKALCDSLSLQCQVVLGRRDGLPYAWNIVSYDGDNYHIDPALCDEIGMSEGFFKNDTQMSGRYIWNRTKNPDCNGPLTYESIMPVVIDEESPPPDDENNNTGEEIEVQ